MPLHSNQSSPWPSLGLTPTTPPLRPALEEGRQAQKQAKEKKTKTPKAERVRTEAGVLKDGESFLLLSDLAPEHEHFLVDLPL